MFQPRVFIVIPVFNRLEDTKQCLHHLNLQSYKNCQIILVDDGSTDGTSEFVTSQYPNAIIVRGAGDWWWTGSIRRGVEKALEHACDKDFVMTLNNDFFLSPDVIEQLVTASSQKPKSLLGAISVSQADKSSVISSGNRMISWFFNLSYHPGYGKKISEMKDSFIPLDMMTGRCVLIPVSLFSQIGNYDDQSFPQYGGDNEFTWRARCNGWSLYLMPSAVGYLEELHTGLNPLSRRLTLKQVLSSFSSIRSANNLKIRTRFAIRCCPKFALPSYLVIMYFKIFLQSFVLNFLFKENKNSVLENEGAHT